MALNKETFLLLGLTFWILFITTVGMFVAGYADLLAYGMISWCAGAACIVQGIKMAIRG